MNRPTEQDTNSSLRRALSILDAFDEKTPELSIRQLAERAQLSRSTTHRLAAELERWGALERGKRGLRLGVKLFELGTMAPTSSTLHMATSPVLHALHEVTGLTANLSVKDGNTLVYIEKIGAPRLQVPHSRRGGRQYLHATAMGKAILAFSGADEVEDLLRTDLESLTSHTIIDPAALRRELAAIRQARVAYDLEESYESLFCVAAPILQRGRAVAAISVTGATALDKAQRFAAAVEASARVVEKRLAMRPAPVVSTDFAR